MSTGEDDVEADDDAMSGDHCWHFKYNRRLSCFQHAVTSLTFSQDGHWLVSGTGSGDVKIWDTGIWAEAARLKGCRHEEPRALAISPAQRWLVCAQSSVLHIFHCSPPWRLEQSLPAPTDPATKEVSEWCCVAFSPMSEVDHPGGHAGQDNHLAAFASTSLCVLDYSGGWGPDTPKRTRSIFHGSRPTTIAYTAGGWWLVCGYECGQIQTWNHFSLTLERTLTAHDGIVNCIASSPGCAQYDSRFISCGMDNTLRVWHCCGWALEQIVPDTRADRNGVRCCRFSHNGNWVLSVSAELCVWRVCVSLKGKMELRLHQRLEAVCGAEGLRTAAFCSFQDAIAVGSRDGVLGLWTKLSGMPPEPSKKMRDAGLRSRPRAKTEPGRKAWMTDSALPRPMMNVRPDGPGPDEEGNTGERRSLQNSEWFVRSDLRSLSRTMSVVPLRSNSSLARFGAERSICAAERSRPAVVSPHTRTQLSSALHRARKSAVVLDKDKDVQKDEANVTEKSWSVLEASKRWKPQNFEFEDVLSAFCKASGDRSHSNSPKSGKMSNTAPPRIFGSMTTVRPAAQSPSPDSDAEPEVSMMRKTMLHAARGLVQRISLDPQVIC